MLANEHDPRDLAAWGFSEDELGFGEPEAEEENEAGRWWISSPILCFLSTSMRSCCCFLCASLIVVGVDRIIGVTRRESCLSEPGSLAA